MKKRIVALVLVVVMSVLSLSSCGSFNFAEEDLSAYASFNYENFKKALKAIEIEDGDFTTNEDTREAKVTKAIYEEIAKAVIAATKEDDRKVEGTLGAGDVLYYTFYAVEYDEKDPEKIVNVYFFSDMQESTITSAASKHVIQLGSIDVENEDDNEFKRLLKKNLVENANLADYLYSIILEADVKAQAEDARKAAEEEYKKNNKDAKEDDIKKAGTEAYKAKYDEKIVVKAGDTIVISYKREYNAPTDDGKTKTVNESAAYERVTLNDTDPFLKMFVAEHSVAKIGGTLAVYDEKNSTEDNIKTKTTFDVEIDGVKYTYSDVKIRWKQDNEKAIKPIATFEYTHEKSESVTPDNCRPTDKGKEDIKGDKLTYFIYPVYAIDVPDEIDGADILNWITGSKLTAESFDVLGEDGYVYKEEGKADVKLADLIKDVVSIYTPTEKDNKFYKEGTLKDLYDEYTAKKEISDKTGSTQAQKNETKDAQTALSEAQKKEAESYVAKIAACAKDKDTVGAKVLEEYRDSKYHSFKEAYDTEIVKAVQNAVWTLIKDSVKVDVNKLPAKLVKEYKEHLVDSYEYEYYKGKYNQTISNYEKFETFDAYLMSEKVLNLKNSNEIDNALDAKAREYLVPIVQIYVVAKACEKDAESSVPAFIEQDIKNGMGYKVDEHAYEETYGDKAKDKIAEAKEQLKESEEKAREEAKKFLIDDAYIKEYKKEIGRAYYKQLVKDYGEINLQASMQFNKLFYYLTSTDVTVGEHDGHKHTECEYETIDGVKYIDFRVVEYKIKADDAESDNK